VVGSISIDRVTHDSLFLETKCLIYVTGAVIVHEYIQKQPVRAILAECPVSHLGQQPSSDTLIGSANHNPLQLYRSVFRKQSPEDSEGIDLSLLIFCNDVSGVGVR
jgi:hypothetical protein